jgi:hypothetical protein
MGTGEARRGSITLKGVVENSILKRRVCIPHNIAQPVAIIQPPTHDQKPSYLFPRPKTQDIELYAAICKCICRTNTKTKVYV